MSNEYEFAYKLILVIHIIAGSVCVVSSLLSIGFKALNLSHKAHLVCGRIFILGMVIVCLSSLLMCGLRPSPILLVLTFFSAYLVYGGFRYAKYKGDTYSKGDVSVAWAASFIGLLLVLGALTGTRTLGNLTYVFIGLGILCLNVSVSQLLEVYKKIPRKSGRIQNHIGMMMGGVIATFTAFGANITPPGFAVIGWVFPTVIFLPISMLMSKRYKKYEHKKSGL